MLRALYDLLDAHRMGTGRRLPERGLDQEQNTLPEGRAAQAAICGGLKRDWGSNEER
jgi:hypothetical protein